MSRTVKATSNLEWRIVHVHADGRLPATADVLATISAADRAEAQQIADRAFPLERTTVVEAERLPLALRFEPNATVTIRLATDEEQRQWAKRQQKHTNTEDTPHVR